MEIRHRSIGAAAALDVTGRLVLGENPGNGRLKDAVTELLHSGQRDIIVNLNGVSQVDTSGLTALVSAHIAAAKRDGRMKLVNANQRLRQVLRATRLDTVFEVFDTESDALESVAASSGTSRP